MPKTGSGYRNILLIGVVMTLLTYMIWRQTTFFSRHSQQFSGQTIQHVYDFAAILPEQDLSRFEWYMNSIMQESDIDTRFVFVKGTGKKSIEQLAVDLVKELKIGAKTREQRGLLLLYDTESQRLKFEVGYGLEEFFPDSFVSYLAKQHVRTYFQAGQESLGLRWLLSLIHYRIREAVLGETFDPRVLQILANKGNLSGGAGASTTVRMSTAHEKLTPLKLNEADRSRYNAQNSPNETYHLYLKWMTQPIYDPNIDLFTSETRNYLSSIPISPAYNDFILFQEYGKQYRIVERNNLAILYFTDTPFVSPHYFIRVNGKWQMDILAEVHDTKEVVGGIYSWTYTGKNDPYSQTFADLFCNLHGYIRFKAGDNRPLITRDSRNL